jgi:transcriptional regulator with XRE-family HTH domain
MADDGVGLMNHESMHAFSSYIRRERERQGLSLERAAARVGLSKSRLRELETGLSLKTRKPTTPTAANIAALARGLGLDQDHLAALAGLGYRLDTNSQQESELLASFRALPASHRVLALRLLEALREPPGEIVAMPKASRAAEESAGW